MRPGHDERVIQEAWACSSEPVEGRIRDVRERTADRGVHAPLCGGSISRGCSRGFGRARTSDTTTQASVNGRRLWPSRCLCCRPSSPHDRQRCRVLLAFAGGGSALTRPPSLFRGPRTLLSRPIRFLRRLRATREPPFPPRAYACVVSAWIWKWQSEVRTQVAIWAVSTVCTPFTALWTVRVVRSTFCVANWPFPPTITRSLPVTEP